MKILKRTGIGILFLILLIIIISFFLSSKVHVERSLEMKTKSEIPFSFVNDLQKWKQWSPWFSLDTTAVYTFSGTTEGAGSWYTWKSKHSDVGSGKLTLTQSKPLSFIQSEMNFGAMGIATSSFKFEQASNDMLKVTWSMDSDGKGIPWYFYVMSKYINLFMDKNVGSAFEKGLNNLKKISEAMPQKDMIAGFEVEEKRLDSIHVLSIRKMMKNQEISNELRKCFLTLGDFMKRNNVKPSGSPMIIIHTNGIAETEIETAIPMNASVKDNNEVKSSVIPSTKAFVVNYMGWIGNAAPVYEQSKKFIESKHRITSGPPREVYLYDPTMEKDTAKWLTQIVFPVE